MFEQTFVQGTGEPRKPWTVAASFTGQLILVAAAMAVPLMQTGRIAWAPPVILYSPPRPAPPPIKTEARSAPQSAVLILRAVFQPRFTVPTKIPDKIAVAEGPPIAAYAWEDPVTGSGHGLTGLTLEQPKLAVEAPPVKSEVKPKPTSIRVGTGVQQALLIRQVRPPYPTLARQARISGTVRLAAIISREGAIQNLQVIGGHPLLAQAALDAVRQWRYKPTLLNGDPVEVITEIDVNFSLSN